MKYRAFFVECFTAAALDKPTRESVKIVDGHWVMKITGNRAEWAEIVQDAAIPPNADQVIEGDTLTARWPSIADQVFGPGGLIARNLPGYEARLPQIHMARLVQRSIEMGEPAIIEAGTGVGKSFAYAAVAMAMNRRVVISTSNKALQAQLYQKDIPFLCKLFPGKKVALAQGKGNFLCRNKCQDKLGNILIEDYTLSSFYVNTDTGNLEELEFRIQDQEKWAIDEDCTGKRCHFYGNCFYYRSKAERQDADVIICNHALLILDRLYPQAQILPGCEVVVVDEAHQLASYARNALGDDFTLSAISKALEAAFEMDASTARGQALLQEFWGDFAAFTAGNKDRQIGIAHKYEFASGQRLAIEMHDIADQIWHSEDTPEDTFQIKRQKRANKIHNLADKIMDASLCTAAGRVRWIEPEPRRFFNVPIDVSEFIGRMAGFSVKTPPKVDRTHCSRCGRALTAGMVHVLDDMAYGPDCIRYMDPLGDAELMLLTEWLGEPAPEPEVHHDPTAVIFCSATLATPKLAHFMRECGIQRGFQAILGSPFDYQSNALLYIPNGQTPEYNYKNPAPWREYMIGDMQRLVLASQGGAFLLFTSFSDLKYAVDRLRDEFVQAGLACFVQGEQFSKGEITKQFRQDGNAVLFATKSFWEGVSIEGAALRLVVISRMPFQATSPLLTAREAAAKDSFTEIRLPEMILDLKQGAGRLIRRCDDKGVIAILDPKIRLTDYGRTFVLPALPPGRLTCNLFEVGDFFQQLLHPPDFTKIIVDIPVNIDASVWAELEELGF